MRSAMRTPRTDGSVVVESARPLAASQRKNLDKCRLPEETKVIKELGTPAASDLTF
jgi:hypothetical protein